MKNLLMKRDALRDRIKADYEGCAHSRLPRHTYTLISVDGRNIHRYTGDSERPFDAGLMEDMAATAQALCEEITGAPLAFVYSDEISVLRTDFATLRTK